MLSEDPQEASMGSFLLPIQTLYLGDLEDKHGPCTGLSPALLDFLHVVHVLRASASLEQPALPILLCFKLENALLNMRVIHPHPGHKKKIYSFSPQKVF